MSNKMSIKSERKKAIKQQKQAQAIQNDFKLENSTFIPDEILRPILNLGAEAAEAKTSGITVWAYFESDEIDGEQLDSDKVHFHDNELHLPLPVRSNALESGTELFRRIVLGWSFFTHIQKGGTDGRSAICMCCVNEIVKEHMPKIELQLTAVYENCLAFRRVVRGAEIKFSSFEEAKNLTDDLVAFFLNDGDIAIALDKDGLCSFFRENMKAGVGKNAGKPIDQESFKLICPVNESLAALVDQKKIPVFVEMAYAITPSSPRYTATPAGSASLGKSEEEMKAEVLGFLEKKSAA